ncbi:substrate-binding domain-containing protein [Brachybacterium sp. J144]|uniref:LacI family DNA-binding transcriptional regulator n=1 Tax=Brachybacterium sp. J144 TaxID=3116487 RepID=UPI002E79A721|nr:substrate-binding domain-containing protein [Brachybacterium sp. J144]MEE1650199.1 substrate-binding domain-containing protein [Brachybacterium sp. J144]
MTQDIGESGRVTLKDVAERAGVSLATASKVMNGRADVRQQTRDTVAQAAQDLGYLPRRRESDKRRSVLLHFDTLTSPYSLQVLEGAEQAAHRAEVDLLVVSGEQSEAGLSRSWMADVAARGVEGLILVTTPIGSQHARWSRDLRLPLIAIDPVSIDPDVQGIVTISATNWEGGSSAVQHLLDLGHRRIGVLAGPEDSVPARQRLQGYLSVLAQAGLAIDQDLIEHSTFSYEDGQRGADRLLERDTPPTAIFAVADTLAVGALRAARQHDVDVPTDLSVVSFDDTMIAQWTYPQLTAVRQPLFSMGQVAVERLLALSSDARLFAHPFKLETQLMVRESTAPPRS